MREVLKYLPLGCCAVVVGLVVLFGAAVACGFKDGPYGNAFNESEARPEQAVLVGKGGWGGGTLGGGGKIYYYASPYSSDEVFRLYQESTGVLPLDAGREALFDSGGTCFFIDMWLDALGNRSWRLARSNFYYLSDEALSELDASPGAFYVSAEDDCYYGDG